MKTLDNARAQAAANLGLDLEGTKGSNLNQKDFFRLEDAMVDVVLTDSGSYPENIVTWAENRKAGTFYGTPPASTSISEKVGIFAGEFANQAQELNPLSEKNRSKTALVIWGVILLGAFVFFSALADRTSPRRNA